MAYFGNDENISPTKHHIAMNKHKKFVYLFDVKHFDERDAEEMLVRGR